MNKENSVFTKPQAAQAVEKLLHLGFKARLQTLKHPGMGAFADSPESVCGYCVSVNLPASEIEMAKSYGYRTNGPTPAGFAWFCGENGYNLTPYPGDNLEKYIDKLTTMRALMQSRRPSKALAPVA